MTWQVRSELDLVDKTLREALEATKVGEGGTARLLEATELQTMVKGQPARAWRPRM